MKGTRNLDLNGEIESFWAGDRIKTPRVKDGLRQIGQQQSYSFPRPKAAELPPQRLRFATELIKGAGYKGWVVLLDEIELVGSYSLLQRGRSYAELTRWMGKPLMRPIRGWWSLVPSPMTLPPQSLTRLARRRTATT